MKSTLMEWNGSKLDLKKKKKKRYLVSESLFLFLAHFD